MNLSNNVNQQPHYHRKRVDKKQARSKNNRTKSLSPLVYLPLLFLGILAVIYAVWNPFSSPAVTIDHQAVKITDFKNLNVKIKTASVYPEKSGGRAVKLYFSGNKVGVPIPLKDNLTVISNHGVLTFKTSEKYLDLSNGQDSVVGTVYGVKLPQEKLAIQIFSDQQKLLVQSNFQTITFPLKIKNLYLQGSYQKSPQDPQKQIGLYLTSNTRYESNVSWDEKNQDLNRTDHYLNVTNGLIDTSIKGQIISYYLKPEEAIQATFYNDPLTNKDVTTKLNRYVAGIEIPKDYKYSWKIEYQNNQYTLVYEDNNQNKQRSILKATQKGTFERFSQALDIPDPVALATQVEPVTPAEPVTQTNNVVSSSPKDKVSNPPRNVSQMEPQEVQQRLLALLLKNWPTKLNPSQVKLFTVHSESDHGQVTYTYTTNGKKNSIQVVQYQLKEDGTINFKATSRYSPNDFSGNIFTDIDKNVLKNFFNN